MSSAKTIRVGLAIAACVGVLVLALLWRTVPAVIEPCSWGDAGGSEQPYRLGTCLRGSSITEIMLKFTIALFAVAAAAVIAARAASNYKLTVGASVAALCALVGFVTIQAISRQVFAVAYLSPLDEMAIVGCTFFLFGALVVWATQKWWPNKSLERTREE
jgi:hypothetical protein